MWQVCHLLADHHYQFQPTPSECIHMDNIIPIVIIPGPKAPKDINSFFCPLINECKLLAKGVCTYDGAHNESFDLHVYPISTHRDMQAIKHCTNLKGSNAFWPCHTCLIQAIWDESKPHSTYYIPLHQPWQPGVDDCEWDLETLPHCTQSEHNKLLWDIFQWDTKEARNWMCQFWGVNGRTELCEIPSMWLFASFPHEWMHLVLENHGKGLLQLWKGTYKDLDEGKQKYIINEAIWALIGSETTLSSSTIPSSFIWHTLNIYTEQYLFTAEDYGHWFLYIAPFVLWNRFLMDKFYQHFMLFHQILKTMLKLSFTKEEVSMLHEMVIKYVREYEKYVHA